MSVEHSHATVFFDRDGTLNRDTGYIKTREELVLFPDTIPAVKRCNDAGLTVIVITNQSGLARGYFSGSDLRAIHEELRGQLLAEGAWIDDILVCPHHPEEGCWCRKPNPGMIEQAAARHEIDLTKSYLVGDKYMDVALAARAKIKGILVKTGPLSEEAIGMIQDHHLSVSYVANRLLDAVDWILEDINQFSVA